VSWDTSRHFGTSTDMTDSSALVPKCLTDTAEMSYTSTKTLWHLHLRLRLSTPNKVYDDDDDFGTSAEMSWVRSVLAPFFEIANHLTDTAYIYQPTVSRHNLLQIHRFYTITVINDNFILNLYTLTFPQFLGSRNANRQTKTAVR